MVSIRTRIAENDGYCTSCRDWTACGGVEPDTHRAECPKCGEPRLYGAEECIMMGFSCIDGDDQDDDEFGD